MTLDEYADARYASIFRFGKDYVKGVDLATEIMVAAGNKQWSLVASHATLLDPENELMMDGYNDLVITVAHDRGFTDDDIDRIFGYIDANLRKGLQ